ncbi:MAG: flagellar basal-body rod protein FlgG [Anaerovibrio sp.]|nr:flagellar basal-body rod protein FlgG [Anaerovibrio sp.]
MMRSLWSAASGMKGQQKQMDVVAHNLANVNTTGAKAQRAEFQDLLYQTLREGGAESGDGNMYPTPMQIGLGSRLSATNRIFVQGNVQTTDNPTDICIQGEGFFQIQMPDGTTGYTRDGSFKIDANRNLVTTDGYPLTDNITFPNNAKLDSIVISSTGVVSCTVNNETQNVGDIQLARFLNPSGLTAVGKNLFVQSAASGEPLANQPGTDGTGTLLQNCLEMSSIQIVDEMVNMIVSQRAYESNSKAITTSDSMLEIANGLKR